MCSRVGLRACCCYVLYLCLCLCACVRARCAVKMLRIWVCVLCCVSPQGPPPPCPIVFSAIAVYPPPLQEFSQPPSNAIWGVCIHPPPPSAAPCCCLPCRLRCPPPPLSRGTRSPSVSCLPPPPAPPSMNISVSTRPQQPLRQQRHRRRGRRAWGPAWSARARVARAAGPRAHSCGRASGCGPAPVGPPAAATTLVSRKRPRSVEGGACILSLLPRVGRCWQEKGGRGGG